jgi:phosphatidylglycerol:prolipoprotein diacylglycerol transferase
MNSDLLIRTSPYGWLMIVAIAVSVWIWSRIGKRDPRLVLIYIGALISAFIGAKVAYVAAEGWLHWSDPNRWLYFLTGKSITGALLGGYLGVEIAKGVLGYKTPTGDLFAVVAPVGIVIGRIGCVLHGCCLGRVCEPGWFTINDADGIARWPAAEVELLFNAFAAALLAWLRWRRVLPGQLFHVYLIAYGLFRFAHEFLRATPRVAGGLSGYQFAALLIASLGCIGFWLRQRRGTTPDLFAPAVQEQ